MAGVYDDERFGLWKEEHGNRDRGEMRCHGTAPDKWFAIRFLDFG
jgi:hypothetical protein